MIKKYSLRRPLNWFSKRGAIGFRHVTSSEEISRCCRRSSISTGAAGTSVGKPSLFDAGAADALLRDAGAHAARGAAGCSSRWSSSTAQPIAFHFGFDYCGCVTWYKPSFEVRYAEHSPGLLLTRELIEDGLQRERVELDFTAGDEAFKGRFASCQRYNVFVGVYHSRIA